jgi:hypothetical protein
MNETKTSCAPADSRNLTWDGMDWSKCEAYVRKLQARIVKAQKEGRHNKVKALQWMLTHSFYAKALAVKRVTSMQTSIYAPEFHANICLQPKTCVSLDGDVKPISS